MKIKHIAGGAFLLNTLPFGSTYAISKEVLEHVDPILISFCEMITLALPALIILACSWFHMTRQAVQSGFILGSCLCFGLFMLSVALRYNTAAGTAFFPVLNGLLAALFTWVFLRQPITKTTWMAAIVFVCPSRKARSGSSPGPPEDAHQKSACQRMLLENMVLDQLKSLLLFFGDDMGVILLDAHTQASPSKLRDALLTQFAPRPFWIVHGAYCHSLRPSPDAGVNASSKVTSLVCMSIPFVTDSVKRRIFWGLRKLPPKSVLPGVSRLRRMKSGRTPSSPGSNG